MKKVIVTDGCSFTNWGNTWATYLKKNSKHKFFNFGQKGMSIGRNNPARRRSFNARMGAILDDVKGQKTLSPAYWAIKSWQPNFKL